jgi:ubiquinone/menaquinone biosynthesis C-methylase UbiE
MTDEEQAAAYASADFSEPNRLFCDELASRFRLPDRAMVIDLGCGPADIPLRLARRYPGWRFGVVDGSKAMLRHAARAIAKAGFEERIRIHRSRVPSRHLPDEAYDIVLSNSLLHHMPDATFFWSEVRRFLGSEGIVMVMDLARPASEAEVKAIVDTHAAEEPEILRKDFANSLRAAYAPAEVVEQVREAGLGFLRVEMVSDRHLLAYGSDGPAGTREIDGV